MNPPELVQEGQSAAVVHHHTRKPSKAVYSPLIGGEGLGISLRDLDPQQKL